METSLCLLVAVGACRTRACQPQGECQPNRVYSLLGACIAAPSVVRLDGLPISIAAMAVALIGLHEPTAQLRRVIALTALSIAVWLSLCFVLTGHIEPDSAAAKSSGVFQVEWLLAFARAMAAVSPLWCLAPVVLVLLAIRNREWMWATVGCFPLVFLLSIGMLRGQFIHGARYFIPSLGFSAAVLLMWEEREGLGRRLWNSSLMSRLAVLIVVAGAALHILVTTPTIVRVLESWRVAIPPNLRGRVLLADIGRISWYAPVEVMDLSGLVNGREVALATPSLRPCLLRQRLGPPAFLVLTDSQEAAFCREQGSRCCSAVQARNFGS